MVYINSSISMPASDRAQAWLTVTSPRKTNEGTEYVELAKETSGLLSNVPPNALLRRAAENVVRTMEAHLEETKAILKGMGLYGTI